MAQSEVTLVIGFRQEVYDLQADLSNQAILHRTLENSVRAMLRLLRISNLAVIDQVQIEFGRGLNLLSGETGSGKSIIIDAVELLLGGRATAEMIRTGEERAVVEGVFEIEGNRPLVSVLMEAGIDPGEEELIVRREIQASGRSRIFVNNQSATLTLLKESQPHLLDVHGQGEQQSLLLPSVQAKTFDGYSGTLPLRDELERLYLTLREMTNRLELLRKTEAEKGQMVDLIAFQIKEIEQARLVENEDAELEKERKILAGAEKILELSVSVYREIYENEDAVLTFIGSAEKRMAELAEIDSDVSEACKQIKEAKYLLEDAVFFLRNYIEKVQFSPERLKEIDERLAEIYRLKRKYGSDLSEIFALLAVQKSRLAELTGETEHSRETSERLLQCVQAYRKLAEQLKVKRRAAVRKFQAVVMKELAAVAMEKSQFAVSFFPVEDQELGEKLRYWCADTGIENSFGRSGSERVEFVFSANPGESPRPIGAVASGGEISRLMLVLKTIIAPTQFPRTLIFDEIDAGIGGRVADAVGQRLRKLAETNQVLCVTHQAQIARYADVHYNVSKSVSGDRTQTRVARLEGELLVDELARMIGGSKITPAARKHARELLATD